MFCWLQDKVEKRWVLLPEKEADKTELGLLRLVNSD